MSRAAMILAFPVFAFSAFAAGAQTAAIPESTVEVSRESDLAPPAPAGRSANLLNGVSFELAVSGDESAASVEYGQYRVRDDFDGEGGAHQLSDSWSIKVSVPVGGMDDLTSQATLDALTNGPKATFSYSIFGFKHGPRFFGPKFKAVMREARENCAREARIALGLARSEPDRLKAKQGEVYCNNKGPDQQFAEEHSSYSDAAIGRALFSSIWRAGFDASVGIDQYDFFDPATLAPRDETKAQFSAGVFGAFYPAGGMSAGILRAEFQHGYEAVDETILCIPLVVDPASDCVKGAPSGPERVDRINLSGEYRHVFPVSEKGAAFAVSPKGTLDALSGDYSIELPVYFIPTWDLPISPGASVSYSSEKDKVGFGLFLRASFTLGD